MGKLSDCPGTTAIIGSEPGKGTAISSATCFWDGGTEYTTWGKKGAGGTVTTSVTYLVVSQHPVQQGGHSGCGVEQRHARHECRHGCCG